MCSLGPAEEQEDRWEQAGHSSLLQAHLGPPTAQNQGLDSIMPREGVAERGVCSQRPAPLTGHMWWPSVQLQWMCASESLAVWDS